MAYTEKVLDHYTNPRNVGSFGKDEPNVGTGIVGAPECGDVMKLQIKIVRRHQCLDCNNIWDAELQEPTCRQCDGSKLNIVEVVADAKFKTFGCGSAIASSSYLTEMVKGKTTKEAMQIKNTFIVKELSLPPVKIHCSVLVEDAIKAALEDGNKKKTELKRKETKT
jgi:nitrogen fixation NifU-like protein